MNTVTINNIVEIFNDIANRHNMIYDFGYGATENIGNDSLIKYPLLWLDTPSNNIQFSDMNTTGFYNIDLYCMDILDKDQINYRDSISDTDFILNNIITELTRSSFYRENQIKIDGSVTKTLSVYDGRDNIVGWQASFVLKFPIRYTNCNIPIDPICEDCED